MCHERNFLRSNHHTCGNPFGTEHSHKDGRALQTQDPLRIETAGNIESESDILSCARVASNMPHRKVPDALVQRFKVVPEHEKVMGNEFNVGAENERGPGHDKLASGKLI
jgi:hypothetical protein